MKIQQKKFSKPTGWEIFPHNANEANFDRAIKYRKKEESPVISSPCKGKRITGNFHLRITGSGKKKSIIKKYCHFPALIPGPSMLAPGYRAFKLQKIVELLNGIRPESTLGEGSTSHFTLAA